MSALEIARQSCTPSTDICRPTSISSLNQLMTSNVGLLSKDIGSMLAGTPVVTNAAAVSSANVKSCDNPQASYVSTSVIGPANTPSHVGQSTNNRQVGDVGSFEVNHLVPSDAPPSRCFKFT